MAKQKIKKGKKSPLEFWSILKPAEKAIVCVPVVAAIALLAYILFWPSNNSGTARGAQELKMQTAGEWSTFNDYGIDVWMPKDIEEEKIEGDAGEYMKLHATRDKGGFPEITVGTVVVPNTEGNEFDIVNDPAGVTKIARPYLLDAFAQMFNGVIPTLSVDVTQVNLEDGTPILECTGIAELTVVYTDPTGKKNEGEPYQEQTDTNIHYAIRIVGGRPVIVWGTWDYSTYQGEEDVRAAVRDGITSLMRADGQEFKAPEDPSIGGEGITEEDKESGLESVPYQGAGGTPEDAPIGADGSILELPTGWEDDPEEGDTVIGEPHVEDEDGNVIGPVPENTDEPGTEEAPASEG